jgi:hypothetical protein
MSSWKTTRDKLLLGGSDANLDFEGVCTMLRHPGFSERRSRGEATASSTRREWLRSSIFNRAVAKENHIK